LRDVPNIQVMSLLDDLKTFLMALALGVALTLSINYVVVNHTEPKNSPAQAVQHEASPQDVPAAPKSDGGGSSYTYY
jgi:hypothetical protein